MKMLIDSPGRFRKTGLGLAILFIAGCASRGMEPEPTVDDQTAGQVIGGVLGAAAGSQIGEGSGQTVATVAGALIGSVVGERIGARMESRDRERTAAALEYNEYNETQAWQNPNTGNEFYVTPTETFDRGGRVCRRFRFRVETELGERTEERMACRQANGTWNIID